MREILFRGKTFSNKQWIEGSLLINSEGRCYIGTYLEMKDKTKVTISNRQQGKTTALYKCMGYAEVDPETISQFTGLTDKNGVKIFENDIIRDCNEDNEVFTVKYYAHRGYPAFDCEPEMHCDCNGLSYLMETGELAVIGNIVDNPELMKGGAVDDETMA